MAIGKYPITKINLLPAPFTNQGYQIWYWFVGGSAFTSPLEPLTPLFWQKRHNAILSYGIWLPAVDVRDRSDVLILVSQGLEHAKKQQKFGNLTAGQRQALFDLILEIDFTHITGFAYMPNRLRLEIFSKYEQTFRKGILPRRDENGKYYRGFNDIKRFGLLQPDHQKRIRCPKCGELVAKDNGLLIISGYLLDDGIRFINAICQCCQKPIGVRVVSPLE